MPDIPDDPIPGRIEHGVQRNGQLHNSEPSADVAAGPRARLDETDAHLFGDGAQLVTRHRLEIRGGVDTVENGHFGLGFRTYG
jgi:hypothetical protein